MSSRLTSDLRADVERWCNDTLQQTSSRPTSPPPPVRPAPRRPLLERLLLAEDRQSNYCLAGTGPVE